MLFGGTIMLKSGARLRGAMLAVTAYATRSSRHT